MKKMLWSCVVATAVAVMSNPVDGAAQGVHPDDVMQATLRPGWRTESGTHMAALQIDLDRGWKTYWRRPGIAGIAPRFNWSDSTNLEEVTLHWPRPEVFDQSGFSSIGYRRQLILPFEVVPQRDGAPIQIDTRVEIGICREICIPATLRLQAELPAGGAPDSEIQRALDRRPDSPSAADVGDHACRVTAGADGALALTASVSVTHLLGLEAAVLEHADADIRVSHTAMQIDGQRVTATADIASADGAPLALDRDGVRLTLVGGDRAVELHGCPSGG